MTQVIHIEPEEDSRGRKFSKWRKRPIFYICAIIIICIVNVVGVLLEEPPPVEVLKLETRQITYDRSKEYTLIDNLYISEAAKKLPKKGKLFCWVQTSEAYHDTRAFAINETWIHRCDHGQLFTSVKINYSNIPYSAVFAGISDEYTNFFYKTRFAFQYIWSKVSMDFDWYLKADDDTFIIVENLRKYLSHLDPDEPHYLGYTVKPFLKNGYNAGGAGYVLSRAALKIVAEKLYQNEIACPDDDLEDLGIGRCLQIAGIYPKDTRNSKGQNRFNTFRPSETFRQLKYNIQFMKYKEKKGYAAFANDLISFHHLSLDEIRLFEILLYRTTVI